MGRNCLCVAVLLILLAGSSSRAIGASRKGNDVCAHVGDLVVAGNDTVIVEDCTFIQQGNVYVRENGTLLLENCEFFLNQSSDYEYKLEVHDEGRLFSLNANISSSYSFDQAFDGNSTVNFTQTCWKHFTWTYASGQSLYVCNSSGLGHLMVSTYAIFDSSVGDGSLLTSENTDVRVNNSRMDTAYIRARDSSVNVTNLRGGRVDYFNTFKNLTVAGGTLANLTVFNSSVRFGFEPYNSSLALSNCDIAGLEAYSNSTVSIANSMISMVHAADGVNLFINNVYVGGYIVAYSDSRVLAAHSYISRVEASDEAFCRFNSSKVTEVSAYEFSIVYAADSTFSSLSASQTSVLSLVNSTCGSGPSVNDQASISISWYLTVHVLDSEEQNVSHANVTALLDDTVASSQLTDADGLARLTLTGKIINATGQYAVPSYSVEVSYLTYLNTTTLNMTGNKQVTLRLEGLIIPEFQAYFVLPLVILALFPVFIARRRKLRSSLQRVPGERQLCGS